MSSPSSTGAAKRGSQSSLSVFALVMINVIAVASLRSLPFGAKLGLKLISFYCAALVGFLIPVGLITAELATTWPERGGIYVWVKEAFGIRFGFLTVWLQWIYNLVWYPTILCFVAATLAFVFEPSLSHHKFYTFALIQLIFWGATLLNCLGMKVSSMISTLGTLLGTLLPFILISLLTLYWLWAGYPAQLGFKPQALIPDYNLNDLSLFTLILFGLMGLEMSAVHAHEVKNPARDYPRALLISSMLIIVVLVWGSLALGLVVAREQMSFITGVPQAYELFLRKLGLESLTPWIALSMVGGAIASVATWIIGPTQGLLAAGQDIYMPAWLTRTNRHGAPVGILIVQAALVSLLSLAYLFSPSIEGVYFILAELTSQLALVMYILFFASALRLRYRFPDKPRPFRVPGGQLGLWLWTLLGGLLTLFGIVVGFYPSSELTQMSVSSYQTVIGSGLCLAVISAMYLGKPKPSTRHSTY